MINKYITDRCISNFVEDLDLLDKNCKCLDLFEDYLERDFIICKNNKVKYFPKLIIDDLLSFDEFKILKDLFYDNYLMKVSNRKLYKNGAEVVITPLDVDYNDENIIAKILVSINYLNCVSKPDNNTIAFIIMDRFYYYLNEVSSNSNNTLSLELYKLLEERSNLDFDKDNIFGLIELLLSNFFGINNLGFFYMRRRPYYKKIEFEFNLAYYDEDSSIIFSNYLSKRYISKYIIELKNKMLKERAIN